MMAHIQNVLVLAVLCVLAGALTQAAAGGHLENGEWSMVPKPEEHNQKSHGYNHNHDEDKEPTWVSCDFTISPRMRCQDCHTRLICKRVGGLLLDCPSSFAPYCNNGLCSPVPSMECA